MNKSVLYSGLLAAALFSSVAHAADSADQVAQAEFANRAYSAAGIVSATNAALDYDKAAQAAATPLLKAQYLIKESASYYFVGDATSDTAGKITAFLKGEGIADQAAKILGNNIDVPSVQTPALNALKASLKPEELGLLGDALYYRAINLGQWGQANGVISSLSKWGELRHNLEIIDTLGLTAIHDYGSSRVLGRAYTKLPSLAGGDYKKALKLLSNAVSKTLVPGQIYSRDGYNNIYYADVLHELGNDDKARAILTAFVKGDPNTINPATVPELTEAQKEAKDDMAGW